MKPIYAIYVYGSSDDLIEIEGDVRDELSPKTDKPYYLLFSDGTQLSLSYDSDGQWCINLVDIGRGQYGRLLAPEIDPLSNHSNEPLHDGKRAPSYSDLATLTWDQPLKLVSHGHRKQKARVETPEAKTTGDTAARIVKVIEQTDGGNFFLHELEPDAYNEFIDQLRGAIKDESPFTGKSFVFTGTLVMSRKDAAAQVEAAGGIVHSTLSSKVDYLVVGEDPGAKVTKARELGVTVIDEAAFLDMIP